MEKRDENAFIATAVAAFVLHFLVSHWYPTLAWPDEIFQTLEQGHRLFFGYGVVPWEFRDGVRSWVLPGLLGLVMRGTAFMGPGSAGYLLGVKLFLALCSIIPAVVAMAWARREKLKHSWVAGLATALWFELVFFSSKALTEVFAAYAVAVAIYFCVAARDSDPPRRAMWWAGLAWGFAVGFRMHLLPAAAVALAMTARKDLKLWKQVLPGAASVVLAFGLLDGATWSYPFQSFVKNFWVNVAEGKADTFGVSPPWEYLRAFGFVWGVGALPLLALAAMSCRRWPVLGCTALAVLLTHSLIPHKEYRFLVPFIVLVVLAASLELPRLLQEKEKQSYGLAACVLLLLASADGARRYDFRELPPRPTAQNLPPFPMWTLRGGELKAFAELSTNPDVCGIAGVGMGWSYMGGYTYLHQDVPMFDIRTRTAMETHKGRFNYVISLSDNGDTIGPFKMDHCYGTLCIYKRDGECEPPDGYTLNGWLASQGM